MKRNWTELTFGKTSESITGYRKKDNWSMADQRVPVNIPEVFGKSKSVKLSFLFESGKETKLCHFISKW